MISLRSGSSWMVSTLASHARGPGFKPRTSQILFLKKTRLCLQILPKLLLKSSADSQILWRRTLDNKPYLELTRKVNVYPKLTFLKKVTVCIQIPWNTWTFWIRYPPLWVRFFWMVDGVIIYGNYQNILYLLSEKHLVTLQNDINQIAVRSIDYLMANSVVFAQTP